MNINSADVKATHEQKKETATFFRFYRNSANLNEGTWVVNNMPLSDMEMRTAATFYIESPAVLPGISKEYPKGRVYGSFSGKGVVAKIRSELYTFDLIPELGLTSDLETNEILMMMYRLNLDGKLPDEVKSFFGPLLAVIHKRHSITFNYE